jgi:predicted nucleotidyltransferase
LADVRLRDRDAIVTKEGLIFRVLGYTHPAEYYVCDAEYASNTVFRSDNPKAFRKGLHGVWYKFFEDEAWTLLGKSFPKYLVFDDLLQKQVVGVPVEDIFEIRKPKKRLRDLVEMKAEDSLLRATQSLVDLVCEGTSLNLESLGVFGSLLHGFYHPDYSDIDLVTYGRENALKLSKALKEFYESSSSALTNEFATEESVSGKPWRFRNLSLKEYWWHQRRKLVYAVFDDGKTGRKIKVEFEPVKDWKEIANDNHVPGRIESIGWVKIVAEVKEDRQAPFIPSVYQVEPREVVEGPKATSQVTRVVSYVEEFRKQATIDELVRVEGNLEKVTTPAGDFYQIALTWCPRYYEQVLKVIDPVKTGIM